MGKFAEYDDYDGLGLAALVAKGDVSPSELVEACIERIEAGNGKLNAVVHKMYERARAQAGGMLPEGPFKGVPFLLKDLHGEDKGEPSTGSCKLLADWIADRDSELVERYKAAGVVIVGRCNTPEFGIYGVTEPEMRGPTHNPWGLGHTPGGSSGGSAAAVAARFVPMAHGGDGGGSIRIPSAHCGLFGMKPSRARNPAGPFHSEGWAGFTCEHVLTRSVRDSAAMLDATQGPDLGAYYEIRDPARPFLDEVGEAPGKLRIAFTTQSIFADEAHPDCVEAVRQAAALAESLGHTVVERHPTYDRESLVRAYLLMISTGVAESVRAAGQRAGRRPKASDFEASTWMLKVVGDNVSASEYLRYRNLIHDETRRLAGFFEEFDVLLTATAARPPVAIGEFSLTGQERALIKVLRAAPLKRLIDTALAEMPKGPMSATPNTMLFNMTGQPAMSVPLFWNSQGLPIGTQWVGRFGDEATLFRLAAQLEAAKPWAGRAPTF